MKVTNLKKSPINSNINDPDHTNTRAALMFSVTIGPFSLGLKM